MVQTRDQYDDLARLYLPIGLAIFALVVVVTSVFLWRYRHKDREPSQISEHMPAEGAWIAIVAAIVVVLIIATFRTANRDDALARSGGVPVHIAAAKWVWTFTYANGATRRDALVVPVGRPVHFDARSLDVLHDFWIPDLRFQRQVWPDHVERFSLVFPHPGRYQGVCAWFCGLYHENMHFVATALPPAQFDRWLAAQGAAR